MVSKLWLVVVLCTVHLMCVCVPSAGVHVMIAVYTTHSVCLSCAAQYLWYIWFCFAVPGADCCMDLMHALTTLLTRCCCRHVLPVMRLPAHAVLQQSQC
jgi:hypothetical protein